MGHLHIFRDVFRTSFEVYIRKSAAVHKVAPPFARLLPAPYSPMTATERIDVVPDALISQRIRP